jgi:hypothetical protein
MITLENVKHQFTIKNPIIKSRVYGKNTINKYTLYKSIDIKLSTGMIITIPKGFKWDLASVPRFLWWLMSPDVDSEIAYLIHDYLYINKIGDRKFADKEMYVWAKVTNSTTNKLSARNIDNWLRYIAVRIFGNIIYKKNKKDGF